MLELTLSTAQVIPLATFCLLAAIMGLLGNGLVVYSSIRYNAIQLDRISIVLVRNLAVADMLYTIVVVIPITVTYFAGRYIMGDIYCFISAHLPFIPAGVNFLTVLTITAYRLRVIAFPLRTVSKRSIHLAILMIWIFAMAGPAVSLGYKSNFVFAPASAKCFTTIYTNEAAAPLWGTVLILQTIIPIILITLFNLVLLLVAYRQKKKHSPNSSVNLKGLITTLLLSGLFICSVTPFLVFTFLNGQGVKVSPALSLIAFHFTFLNVGGNPILYTITNRRFGKYVQDLANRIVCCGSSSKMGGSNSTFNSRGVLPGTGLRQPFSLPNQQRPMSSVNHPAADTTATSMVEGMNFENTFNQDTVL